MANRNEIIEVRSKVLEPALSCSYFLTMANIKSLLEQDNRLNKVSSNAKKYSVSPENLDTAYVVLNTWLLMVNQYSRHGAASILARMRVEGFRSEISKASDSADEYVRDVQITDSCYRQIVLDVSRYRQSSGDSEMDIESVVLTLLRFPKRLSLAHVDLLDREALEKFYRVEQSIGSHFRSATPYHTPWWLIGLLREKLGQLPWKKFLRKAKAYSPWDGLLSTGVAVDAKSHIEKIVKRAAIHPELTQVPMTGLPHCSHEFDNLFEHDEDMPVDPMAVPKTYKSSRIIAPEWVDRQSEAKYLSRAMEAVLPDTIRLHDQTFNQSFCSRIEYATIDQSNASDHVTKWLVSEIFPTEVARIILRVVPTHFTHHYAKKDVKQALYSFAPAGNALTFIVESLVFWSIQEVACDIVAHMIGQDDGSKLPVICYSKKRPIYTAVYGDDGIVPTACAETVMDIFCMLGFEPNMKKSFFSATCGYRESCGAEYLHGHFLDPLYFPRKPLYLSSPRWKVDGFTGEVNDSCVALSQLQHRMYHSFIDAAIFIVQFLNKRAPWLSTSKPESNSSTPWDYVTFPRYSYPPYALPESDKPYSPGEWVDIGNLRYHIHHMASDGRTAFVDTITLRDLEFSMGRELCQRPSMKTKEVNSSTVKNRSARSIVEDYEYAKFLKYGPCYSDDDLLRLLGITKPYSIMVVDDSLVWEWTEI